MAFADGLQTVLKEFHWKGRDLHSQRRYLALRLRFRGEPYGYMIAHDIHDAVKLSRRRTRKRRKEAKKQIRKDIKSYKKTGLRSPPPSATQESSLGPSQHHSGKDNPKEVGSSTTKAEPKPTDVAITIQKTSPKPQQMSATPPENPFEDPPTADVQRHKHKKEKRRKKEKAKMASPEAPDASEDPFRDPEPMQVIDADDFRLESPDRSGQRRNSSEEALLPQSHRVGSSKIKGRSKKERKHRKRDKTSDDHVRNPVTEVKPMQTAMRLSGGGYRISLRVS
ncbi:hypothetical protein F5Y08DRAFT_173968 [Xylaria arbuscula]|nr:hypothetical protein F5Y08DRAFT_173968 [Xylaria arbuscula]